MKPLLKLPRKEPCGSREVREIRFQSKSPQRCPALVGCLTGFAPLHSVNPPFQWRRWQRPFPEGGGLLFQFWLCKWWDLLIGSPLSGAVIEFRMIATHLISRQWRFGNRRGRVLAPKMSLKWSCVTYRCGFFHSQSSLSYMISFHSQTIKKAK